jgi:hypothetical protein
MPPSRKYKIGDVFNNRKIIGYVNHIYRVQCLQCGKIAQINSTTMQRAECNCIDENKIKAMKEKYKNGVTIEHLKEWLGG